MRIGHAMPLYGKPEIEAMYSALRDVTWCRQNGHHIDLWYKSTCNVARSRNLIVRESMELGHDLLVMQDADVWSDATAGSALYRLLTTLRQSDASVAAAVYRKRGVGENRVNVWPLKPGEVYEAEWCAIGLALFDMRKLRDLPMPWFQFEFDAAGCEIVAGEDIYFCRHARAGGHRIVADWTIPTYHADARYLPNGEVCAEE